MDERAGRQILEQFLRAIEGKDPGALGVLLHEELVRIEHPNRFSPRGSRSDRAGVLAGLARGAQLLRSERYTIEDVLVSGSRVAARLRWEATLAVGLGELSPGDPLSAHLALFLTVQDGQLIEVINYDCVLPPGGPQEGAG